MARIFTHPCHPRNLRLKFMQTSIPCTIGISIPFSRVSRSYVRSSDLAPAVSLQFQHGRHCIVIRREPPVLRRAIDLGGERGKLVGVEDEIDPRAGGSALEAMET